MRCQYTPPFQWLSWGSGAHIQGPMRYLITHSFQASVLIRLLCTRRKGLKEKKNIKDTIQCLWPLSKTELLMELKTLLATTKLLVKNKKQTCSSLELSPNCQRSFVSYSHRFKWNFSNMFSLLLANNPNHCWIALQKTDIPCQYEILCILSIRLHFPCCVAGDDTSCFSSSWCYFKVCS